MATGVIKPMNKIIVAEHVFLDSYISERMDFTSHYLKKTPRHK